jgi:predicted transcriptional regulator
MHVPRPLHLAHRSRRQRASLMNDAIDRIYARHELWSKYIERDTGCLA